MRSECEGSRARKKTMEEVSWERGRRARGRQQSDGQREKDRKDRGRELGEDKKAIKGSIEALGERKDYIMQGRNYPFVRRL